MDAAASKRLKLTTILAVPVFFSVAMPARGQLDDHRTFAAGPSEALVVQTLDYGRTPAGYENFADWAALDGSQTTVVVPEGQARVVVARFTVTHSCSTFGSSDPVPRLVVTGRCRARIVAYRDGDGFEFHPRGRTTGGVDTFDSVTLHYSNDRQNPDIDGYVTKAEEQFSFERSLRLGGGSYNVQVELRTENAVGFLYNWHFAVDTRLAPTRPVPGGPK